MKIYNYTDYKTYLQELIQGMPRNGHGVARKLAEHLRVNSVAISQVLSGDRHFTPEQALQVAQFFEQDESSTEYLIQLVYKERAGTVTLAEYHEKRLEQLREEDLKLRNRVSQFTEISEEDKGVFYSNWYYAAIRQVCAIQGYENVEVIAERFNISPQKVSEAVEFLVSRGLCVVNNGKIERGPVRTFIDANSPYINNHRRNWRLKAMERMIKQGEGEYFFSGLYTITEADFQAIRQALADLIAENSKRVKNSRSWELACINIDWFKL